MTQHRKTAEAIVAMCARCAESNDLFAQEGGQDVNA